MEDRFDYRTYWALITGLTATHRPVRFAELKDRFPDEPFFILRHDVDYSTQAALLLAEQESDRGIHATYFLLPGSLYYNLLDPEYAGVPRRLIDLGHEVGLHYDVNLLRQFASERSADIMRLQTSLLETLSGAAVVSIAMHQPGLNGEDPLRNTRGFLNAYDDRFVREMPYFSDSCRAWRDSAWNLFDSGELPSRFQLALHPINWSTENRDRIEVFRSVHCELASAIEAAGRDLLDKIQRHQGVLEHQARAQRMAESAKEALS
jgi:hypothetical protein